MKILLIAFNLAFSIFYSQAQSNWSYVKEQDGIKMYTRASEHSKFNDIKIEADFTGTQKKIIDILTDVEKYTQWAYATKTSTMIKKISPLEFIYYSEYDVPWPANNRDFYAHCKIFFDSSTHTLNVISASISNYMPEKKNIVRVPLSKGIWKITALSDKKIHVDYVLELDPGGNVPSWLINLFSTTGPMETFRSLKKKLMD